MTVYEKSSDQELVCLLNKGDQSAYTEIYNRYHAVLYIHVFNKISIRETARDIVHDLFSNVWLQSEENVDKRRASVGLQPLELMPGFWY